MSAAMLWPNVAQAVSALHAHYRMATGDFQTQDRKLTAEELEAGFAGLAPAVVELASGEALVVPEEGWLLTPSGLRRKPSRGLRTLWEEPLRVEQRKLFAALPVSKGSAERVISRLIRPLPAARVIVFQAAAGGPFGAQLSEASFFRRAGSALLAHGLAYALILIGWALIGRAAFSGQWDEGWFWGWGILLAASVPLDAFAEWQQGWLATVFGGLLKQRLLASSLVADSDQIRSQGAGQLLSKVFESDALEGLSLAGGTAGILALVEIGMGAAVMLLGSTPLLSEALLAVWMCVVGAGAVRFSRLRGQWLDARLRLTHRLAENMSGHRTRIAQQAAEQWHAQEDEDLAIYAALSARMDTWLVRLTVLGPRGWLMLGCVAVSSAFLQGAAAESAALTLGGVLLAYQAMRRLATGLVQVTAAWQSWQQLRDLFRGCATAVPAAVPVKPSSEVLSVRNVSFSYPRRETAVLSEVNLTIQKGDRILLEGASGGGKSTLGALIAGLRLPSSGLILSGGLDLATLGELGWRKRVGAAPQYHENHILSAPLAFNLLMGRVWPAQPQDLEEARVVCEELGLGPLLGRLPAGLWEMMGETGWQLSHGERSRVFLARALLQGAELIVLDESFAALDPASLEQCLQTALRRAPSLMVIAHP